MFRKNKDNLDEIFEKCLDSILTEEKTVDECIAEYPQHDQELKSLLAVSLKTQKAMNSVKANPDFKARLKYILESELENAATQKRFSLKLGRGWATATFAVALAVLLSGGGTVAAASGSMPTSPLYNVKLATEEVQLFLTADKNNKADLYSKFVTKRVGEIVTMASKNNTEGITKSSQRMQNQLTAINSLSADVSAYTKEISGHELTNETLTPTVTQTMGGTVTAATTTTTVVTDSWQFARTLPAHVTNRSNQLLIDDLYENILALYAAAGGNSGSTLDAIIAAIDILEKSYNEIIGGAN
ncbi:MAG: DUF5667 domain-containing protein [Dehalococcoidales bacterium]